MCVRSDVVARAPAPSRIEFWTAGSAAAWKSTSSSALAERVVGLGGEVRAAPLGAQLQAVVVGREDRTPGRAAEPIAPGWYGRRAFTLAAVAAGA